MTPGCPPATTLLLAPAALLAALLSCAAPKKPVPVSSAALGTAIEQSAASANSAAPTATPVSSAAPSAAPARSAAPVSTNAPGKVESPDDDSFGDSDLRRGRASMGTAFGVGFLPSPGFGASAALGFQWRRFSMAVEGRVLLTPSFSLDQDHSAWAGLVLGIDGQDDLPRAAARGALRATTRSPQLLPARKGTPKLPPETCSA
jgi:hypothetical protein